MESVDDKPTQPADSAHGGRAHPCTRDCVRSGPSKRVALESGYYRIVNLAEGRYTDLQGNVLGPSGAEDAWVQELEGASFDGLIQSIQAKAGS